MKPEIKELWINALLSGEYEQGKGALCQIFPDGTKEWCCLGVLTDLAIKAGVPLEVKMNDDPRSPDTVLFDNTYEKLPVKVQEWSGLETDLGNYKYPDLDIFYEDIVIEHSLAEDNDNGEEFAGLVATIRDFF